MTIGAFLATIACFRIGYDKKYRTDLQEYKKRQKALPKEERDGYGMHRYNMIKIKIGITVLILLILTIKILSFFNLLY